MDVIRYTTFFHQFTLVFDELKREKYVDWYGYSASASAHIFSSSSSSEVGYKFRPEFIIDQGYYNNQYRVPSKEFKDFMAFQRREVAKLAKEMVDITHELGKEAMMFLGDHWIGTEPFMDEFKTIGLDAVVGSVGNGSTLRLISDIPGVKYTEGRFLPYFFPDTFHEGGDPVREAKENWVTARRAILRKPIDRIGYGGYLKLACEFPEFIDYVESVCDEFRELYENITRHHALLLQDRGRAQQPGGKRALLGLPHGAPRTVSEAELLLRRRHRGAVRRALRREVHQLRRHEGRPRRPGRRRRDHQRRRRRHRPHRRHLCGRTRLSPAAIKRFVCNGGGFIGVGEPTGHQYQGRYLQLAQRAGRGEGDRLHPGLRQVQLGRAPRPLHPGRLRQASRTSARARSNMYALEGTEILVQREKEVQMAVNAYGAGRAVYISGLPYSFENSRVLHRAILWSSPRRGASCTPGSPPTTTSRSTPTCQERQVLRGQQHL